MPLKPLIKQYKPDHCHDCGQTTTYLLAIDRGTVDILRAVAVAIRRKGVNIIHPRKEMECEVKNGLTSDVMVRTGKLTSNQVGNLSRPRFHGLIASIDDNPGNYCLTTKGAKFLKGQDIPRYAIISKAQGKQIGYYLPEEYRVTIDDFNQPGEYWENFSFKIVEGRVVGRPENVQLPL